MVDDNLARLLQALSDGRYHSGQALADALSISRTAVWKQVQRLQGLGLELQTRRGQGYCLPGGLELLDESAIARALAGRGRSLALSVHPVIDSTNQYLLRQSGQLPAGVACLAEQQTAGRGRRGRQWVSPFARNLYLSLHWRFEGGASVLEGLSLAVGVVIAEALEDLGIADVQLKWPNDVLAGDRKLAGILLEMSGDPAGHCQVVVGVGVNVAMGAAAGKTIDQQWVDLQQLAQEAGRPRPSRHQLAVALLDRLAGLLEGFAEQGFAAWRERWLARAAYLGERVSVSAANRSEQGVMLGVDDSGALRLRIDGEERLFHGGEVSVRPES